MKIIEINSYADFFTLEKEWNNTLQKCNHTIFSTWEWLSTWWKHFGKDKKLVLLLAKENDKVLGIAPLMYSVHKMFGLRMGKIEFIGASASDYNDFIIAEKQEECIKLFINHLTNLPEKWDFIDLMDIPENSSYLPYLRKLSKILKPFHECPYIFLPDSYEKFLMNLSRNLKRNINRALRRLQETFKIEYNDYSKPELLTESMQYLFDLHQKRWRSRGFSGIFADEKTRAFHLNVAKLFSEKNWLGLFLISLNGNPAAAAYGFKYQHRFYGYISGFDPAYYRYDVGNLLMAQMINQSIQEGFVEFDFGRGSEEYKRRWNTMSRWNYQAVLTKKGFIENIKNCLYKEYWRQGNRLKHILKIRRNFSK